MRRPHPGVAGSALIVASVLAALGGCRKRAPATEAGHADAVLPPGCAVAARLDVTALAATAGTDALTPLLPGFKASELLEELQAAGIEPARAFNRIGLCRLTMGGAARSELGIVLTGEVPPDLLSRLARVNPGMRHENVGGRPALAGARLWLAARGAHELVFATDRDLLGRFLSGADGHYGLETPSMLSIVLGRQVVEESLSSRGTLRPVAMQALQSVRVVLEKDGTSLAATFTTNDADAASKLQPIIQSMATLVERRPHGAEQRVPQISVTTRGASVQVTGHLPDGVLRETLRQLSASLARTSLASGHT